MAAIWSMWASTTRASSSWSCRGACAGCPMSSLTLSMGIERILKEHVPGVTRVEQVNASGETDDLYDEYAPF